MEVQSNLKIVDKDLSRQDPLSRLSFTFVIINNLKLISSMSLQKLSSLTLTKAALTSSNLVWAFGTVGCFSGNIVSDFFLKALFKSLRLMLSISSPTPRVSKSA